MQCPKNNNSLYYIKILIYTYILGILSYVLKITLKLNFKLNKRLSKFIKWL